MGKWGGGSRDKTKSKQKRRGQHELSSKKIKGRKTGKKTVKGGEQKYECGGESWGNGKWKEAFKDGSLKENTAISSLVYPIKLCTMYPYGVLSMTRQPSGLHRSPHPGATLPLLFCITQPESLMVIPFFWGSKFPPSRSSFQ